VAGKDVGSKVQASKNKKENLPTLGGKVPEVKPQSRLTALKEKLPSWCTRLVSAAVIVGFLVASAVLIQRNVDIITEWFRSSWCKQAFEKISTLAASDFSDKFPKVLSTLPAHFDAARTLLQSAIQTVIKLPSKDVLDRVVLFLWTNRVAVSAVNIFGIVAGAGVYIFVFKKRAKTA